ncbi:aldo/keto reductase [Klebsiella pneumoniae]|nr:aldo/keto reductase [Klebsiella pneumoniae]
MEEEIAGTMADLVKEGQIRHIGPSEVSAQTLRRACKVHPIDRCQADRNTKYGAASRRLVFSTPFSKRAGGRLCAIQLKFGRGFPTGTTTDPGVLAAADDFRRHLPSLRAETMRKNQLLLECLQQVATRYDAILALISVSRLADEQRRGYRAHPGGGSAIAHPARQCRRQKNITLALEDILTIEHIFTADNVTGLRYTQWRFLI